MDQQLKEQYETLNRQLGELSSIYRDAIKRIGVSENEYWTWITLLHKKEACSQQDICNIWSLPKQTVNTVVTNMVKKGYAVLKAASGARNRKNIELTESGREYGKSIVSPIEAAELRTFEKVPLEVRLACSFALEKYLIALRTEMAQL